MDKDRQASDKPFVHQLADVQTECIGSGTRIWQYCVVLKGVTVGRDCNICSHCFLEGGVVLGNRVTVKSGVQLWNGLHVGDDVFIGPNATFTNDKYPRSKQYPAEYARTIIENGASIGANSTILAGITIGKHAMVGAGSVVTKDIPEFTICYGNPARPAGVVTRKAR